MISVLTNKLYFSVFFFFLLFLDIAVKLNLESTTIRLFSKPLVGIAILSFYYINNRDSVLKSKLVIVALISFLLGDICLIFYEVVPVYIIGLILFIIGKLCYTYRFSNERDFSMSSLFPFLALCFAYMVFIMLLVIDKLGVFLFPVILYLFACLTVILFAFLRKGDVNTKSFIFVLFGVTSAIFCDSIGLIQSFYLENFPYHKFSSMFFYGLSQYLIVMGLLAEDKETETAPIL